LPVDLGNFDFVGTDEPPSHQIDEVASQKVFGQKYLAGTSLEPTEVDPTALETHTAFFEATNLANGNKKVSTFDANDYAHQGWVRVQAEACDEVVHAPDPVTIRIKDGPANESRKVKNLGHNRAPTGIVRLLRPRTASQMGEMVTIA
jgi:hypothetical protein